MTCLSCCSQTKRRSLLHRLREHLSRSSALTPRALSICSVWCGAVLLMDRAALASRVFPLRRPVQGQRPCRKTPSFGRSPLVHGKPQRGQQKYGRICLFSPGLSPSPASLVWWIPLRHAFLRCPVRIQSPLERSCGGVGAGPASLWASHDAIVLGRSPNITPIRGRNLTVARRSITARRTARCAVLPLLVIFATENF